MERGGIVVIRARRFVERLGDLELGLAIYAGERWEGLAGGEWWPVSEIEAAGLPTLFAKAALKKKYDPENLFRLNPNIKPAG